MRNLHATPLHAIFRELDLNVKYPASVGADSEAGRGEKGEQRV